MRREVCTTLRKIAYAGDYSPRYRKYKMNVKTGQVIADERRQAYQGLKKWWRSLTVVEKKGLRKTYNKR